MEVESLLMTEGPGSESERSSSDFRPAVSDAMSSESSSEGVGFFLRALFLFPREAAGESSTPHSYLRNSRAKEDIYGATIHEQGSNQPSVD